ncbi:hypothetical protein Tco_0128113 [Tanacetum coccineum]
MDEFSDSSGLFPNPSKSTVFFGNVGNSDKEEILSIMPFSVGTLPVRYLGVPLITKRFGVKQCKSLIDKVEKKVKDWKNRWLSFAGRLQLISSVLLPYKSTIQGDLTNGKAKIAWSEVCKLKANGGLGIKDLNLWNKAMLGWKNLLIIRDHIFHHVVYKIGNGINVSMWNDHWAEVGVLSNYITHISMYTTRLSNSLKVADMIEDQCWKWPNEWMRKYLDIVSILVPTLNSTEDKVSWKNKRRKIVKLSP